MRQVFRYVSLVVLTSGIPTYAHHVDNESAPNSADVGVVSASTTQNSSFASPVQLVTPTFGNGTCWSRTANYITHTLPQQCLRTERGSANSIGSPDTNDDRNVHAGSATTSVSQGLSTENVASSIANDGTATDSSTSAESAEETDSPLDNANFLSFEEWKRQNQAKAEQAAEAGNPPSGPDRQRPGINNALDSLGDEGEIDIDFSGFGSGASGPRKQQAAYRTDDIAVPDHSAATTHTPRSKDAGKTCKERTNYASFDCAATILKHNWECKSASSVLVENKDSYMLNTCSANNKFFIVELCNTILIDTVVLANYEFFSSIFRHFRVSVSGKYPVKMDKWTDLGTFEARNTREVQAFLIEHPQIWARYLRIEMLSHYGSEYYCPVSLLRVHGTTMLEDVGPEDLPAPGETAEEELTLEAEATAQRAIPQVPVVSTDETEKATLQAMPAVEILSDESLFVATGQSVSSTSEHAHTTSEAQSSGSPSLFWTVDMSGVPTSVAIPLATELTCASNMTSASNDESPETSTTASLSVDGKETAQSNRAMITTTSNTASSRTSLIASETSANEARNGTSIDTVSSLPNANDAANTASMSAAPSESSSASSSTLVEVQSSVQHESQPISINTTRTTPTVSSSTVAIQPQATQESFFKSIRKRLQQLEANSTLSLQYIEEQSRILRDAFSKVEKRQITATTSFLNTLNETVVSELHGFRQAYDQLWQSTVIELEGQRELYQREMLALSTRLSLVADELVWQKRVGIVQSTLLLLCLGHVLFARTGQGGYLEMPLMQQMRNKSYTTLNGKSQGWESPPASPSPDSRSPVRLLRRKLMWRSYTEPSISTDSRPGSSEGPSGEQVAVDADIKVEPPTPDSEATVFAIPTTEEAAEDVVDMREVRSSPSTPTGTRELEREGTGMEWDREGVGVT